MLFIECSAKTKLGIHQAFEELVLKASICLLTRDSANPVAQILDTPSLYRPSGKETVSVNKQEDNQNNQPGCYC